MLRCSPFSPRLGRLAAIVVLGCGGSFAQAAAAERPNILLLMADDLGARLGCYGDPVVKTPHLDRLAAEGVRFDRAYAQVPLCGPSRASLLTGLRPDRVGIFDNTRRLREVIGSRVTLPQAFRRHGYRTARVGKIFHMDVPRGAGQPGDDDPRAWEVALTPVGREMHDTWKSLFIVQNNSQWFGFSWLDADGGDEEQTDGRIATEAIRLLGEFRAQSQPFFLAVGFLRPHYPFVAPRRYFELYPRDTIQLPEVSAEEAAALPGAARWLTEPLPADRHEALRDVRRAYFAAISYMDAQVGRVLAALEASGLAGRTLVLFTSDHGMLMGEHGQWHKHALFEEVARVPLIVRGPGVRAPGRTVAQPVQLLDVFPTFAEFARLKLDDSLDGVSFAPLVRGEPQEPRPAFTQIERPQPGGASFMGRSVRTAQWRYTAWDDGRRGRELYDHTRDPGERRNLAASAERAETVATLDALLRPPAPLPPR